LLVSSNFLAWVTSSISSSCESSKMSTSDILIYFSNYAAYETQSHVLRIFQNFFNMHNFHWIIPQIIYSTRDSLYLICNKGAWLLFNNHAPLL
jgi:hypothetical protein